MKKKKTKSDGFMEKLKDNSMVDYFSRLTILNPASIMSKEDPNAPRREGRYVRLAHANAEFSAPILTKGKSVASARRQVRKRR